MIYIVSEGNEAGLRNQIMNASSSG